MIWKSKKCSSGEYGGLLEDPNPRHTQYYHSQLAILRQPGEWSRFSKCMASPLPATFRLSKRFPLRCLAMQDRLANNLSQMSGRFVEVRGEVITGHGVKTKLKSKSSTLLACNVLFNMQPDRPQSTINMHKHKYFHGPWDGPRSEVRTASGCSRLVRVTT